MRELIKKKYINMLEVCLDINIGDTIQFYDKSKNFHEYVVKETIYGEIDLFGNNGRSNLDFTARDLDSFRKHFYIDVLFDVILDLKVIKTGRKKNEEQLGFKVINANTIVVSKRENI